MKQTGRSFTAIFRSFFCILFLLFLCAYSAFSYPITFVDSTGNSITIKQKPSRIVSLVPSITEMVFSIGAGDSIKGITYHTTYPPQTGEKQIVGGFLFPSIKIMKKIKPDIVFISGIQSEIRKRLQNETCMVVDLETNSVSDIYRNISLLGRIFNKEREAASTISRINNEFEVVHEKLSRIPRSKRKRVIRVMGRERVMTPGSDSFQNEYIRLAGGIPLHLNKKGNVVNVTKEEWVQFNPQVIYGCGRERETAKELFERPGWKDVDAVKNKNLFFFPCDLTCRASTHAGYFVSWLSSTIYRDEFLKDKNLIFKDHVSTSRDVHLDLPYVKDAQILYSTILDFSNKTLIIDFKSPQTILSTLEGWRERVKCVGNHYSSPPCWPLEDKLGLKKLRERVLQTIGRSEDTSSLLFTGADMDNLAIIRKRFREMEIYALVTAGVKSNAVRMSKDIGRFYEPGTINIILLPNMLLTKRAMSRAIISATEAKTAALQDLDIRSSYTPRVHQSTGTGTDNIIVAEGTGRRIENAGGHTKMGELIAKAVYEAVRKALYKQNSIIRERNIFQRLEERNIGLYALVSSAGLPDSLSKKKAFDELQELLLTPEYASFLEASFAISDDYERGLIRDLKSYRLWCKEVSERISGKKILKLENIIKNEKIPLVMRSAFNAFFNGIYYKVK